MFTYVELSIGWINSKKKFNNHIGNTQWVSPHREWQFKGRIFRVGCKIDEIGENGPWHKAARKRHFYHDKKYEFGQLRFHLNSSREDGFCWWKSQCWNGIQNVCKWLDGMAPFSFSCWLTCIDDTFTGVDQSKQFLHIDNHDQQRKNDYGCQWSGIKRLRVFIQCIGFEKCIHQTAHDRWAKYWESFEKFPVEWLRFHRRTRSDARNGEILLSQLKNFHFLHFWWWTFHFRKSVRDKYIFEYIEIERFVFLWLLTTSHQWQLSLKLISFLNFDLKFSVRMMWAMAKPIKII